MTNVAAFKFDPPSEQDHERMCCEIVSGTFVTLLERVQQLRRREAILSARVEEEVATVDVGVIHAIETREQQLAAILFHICSSRQEKAHLARMQELHEHVWKANSRLQGILRRNYHAYSLQQGRDGERLHQQTAGRASSDRAHLNDDGLTNSSDGGAVRTAKSSPPTSSSAFRRQRRQPSRGSTVAGSDGDDSVDDMMSQRLRSDAEAFAVNSQTVRMTSRGRKQRTVFDEAWSFL
jgi:hypothetical protein